jgi:hypothetical protein
MTVFDSQYQRGVVILFLVKVRVGVIIEIRVGVGIKDCQCGLKIASFRI